MVPGHRDLSRTASLYQIKRPSYFYGGVLSLFKNRKPT